MSPFIRGTALLLAAVVVAPLSAQSDPKSSQKGEKTLGAVIAERELQAQGEYEGTIGKDKYGVQIVALGKGGFDVYFLKGGLPGAGWDLKTKLKATAKLSDEGPVAKIAGKINARTESRTDSKVESKTDEALNGKAIEGSIAISDESKLTAKIDGLGDASFTHVFRKSPTLGAKAPEGALILFDGTNTDEWDQKKIVDGLLPVAANSKKKFKDFTLHIEFRTPFQPNNRGQGRGNSGVYVNGRDEVQVLDSFGLEGKNDECGGIYSRKIPAVNMCLPPLSWQTYDIDVTTDSENPKKAKITVRHNGVLIHENVEISGGAGPINLQNHGDPVFYKNIWLVEKK